jgi:hypothetical protein
MTRVEGSRRTALWKNTWQKLARLNEMTALVIALGIIT